MMIIPGLVLGLTTLLAQEREERFHFLPGGTYEARVPTPEQILGYPLGSRFTEHWRIAGYLEALAKASSRISYQIYGKSGEGRPLYLATIAAPKYRAKLESIRESYAKLADPRIVPALSEEALAQLPAAAWLSFNVHGNESSGTEAALATLYQLAAGNDAATLSILENTIVLLDPCLNPDGRDRYVNWYRSVAGPAPNADPKSQEHDEPWPGGRYNHFLFDLNRDWAFLTQPETKQRIAAYLPWNPQVHVDFHEMDHDSSYFFFPADLPINRNLPESTVAWQKVFGQGNAAAFDAFGWLYYTGERFDLFYPGYGDSWPSLQGAIGMTYEQAGHGTAGLAVRRKDDTVLTLHDRTWHHFTAAMATLQTASANRKALLQDFRRFFRSAMEEGKDRSLKSYIFSEGSDPARAAALVSLLLTQGIEVHRAKEPFLAGPLQRFPAKSGELHVEKEKFPAGSYVVSLLQPRRRLANALLEPEPAALDLYFYDVSAWSLPLAYGVEAWSCEGTLDAPLELLREAPAISLPALRKASYAYVIPWDSGKAPALVSQLSREGFAVKVAGREFRLGMRDFPRGSAIVPVANNSETLFERLQSLAARWQVPVFAVESGHAERGIDLGSDHARNLRPRRIAVVTGEGVSPASYGAIRFLLEQENEIEFSAISMETIRREESLPYHCLVLPEGSGYADRFDKEIVAKLQRWVRAGGNLVAVGNAAGWATGAKSGLSKIELATPAKPENADAPRTWTRIEDADAMRRRRELPGTILAVKLDPAHRIAFGYGEGPVHVMQQSERAFVLSDEGLAVGVFADDPKVAGYLHEEKAAKFRDKAYLVEVTMGEGRIVLFADDPNFRMAWQGLSKLFLNAILLPAE